VAVRVPCPCGRGAGEGRGQHVGRGGGWRLGAEGECHVTCDVEGNRGQKEPRGSLSWAKSKSAHSASRISGESRGLMRENLRQKALQLLDAALLAGGTPRGRGFGICKSPLPATCRFSAGWANARRWHGMASRG
jgi:hypothetical protein